MNQRAKNLEVQTAPASGAWIRPDLPLKASRGERGFTLLEAVIALLLMTIGALGFSQPVFVLDL